MQHRRLLKLKGYIPILRRSLLLLKEMGLGFDDYGFYHFLLIQVDWDKEHSTYGCIVKSDVELAIDSRCDPSTIGRRKRSLLKHGLIEIDNNLVRIKNFERFTLRIASRLAKLNVASLQEDFAQMQSVIAEMQNELAESQTDKRESSNSFNVSSNENLSLSKSNTNSDHSSDELIGAFEKWQKEQNND